MKSVSPIKVALWGGALGVVGLVLIDSWCSRQLETTVAQLRIVSLSGPDTTKLDSLIELTREQSRLLSLIRGAIGGALALVAMAFAVWARRETARRKRGAERGAERGAVELPSESVEVRAEVAPVAAPAAETLRLALEASSTCIWDFNLLTQLVTLDAGWSVMLGGEAEATTDLMRRVLMRVHPDDRAQGFRAVMACANGRQDSYNQEYRVQTFEGGWIWINSRGRVTDRDAQGRGLRMAGTNTDINRRKLAELAVAKQMEFLRGLNRCMLVALAQRERDDIIRTVAEQTLVLFGVAQVEVALNEGRDLRVFELVKGRPGGWSAEAHEGGRWSALGSGEPDMAESPAGQVRVVFPLRLDEIGFGAIGIIREGTASMWSAEDREHGLLLAQTVALILQQSGRYAEAVREAHDRSLALREQEAVFRRLIENIAQGFYTADGRSLFSYCNPAVTVVLGKEASELKGKSSFRIVDPVDRPRVVQLYRDWAAGTEIDVSTEFRIAKANGQVIWVEQLTHIVRNPDGTVHEFQNYLRDITEKRAGELALRESEERFRGVFDKSPVMIALLSLPDGHIVEVNAAIEAAWGIKADDVRGKSSVELGVWVDPARRELYLERLRREGQVTEFEAEMRRLDGSVMPVLFSGSLVTIGGKFYSLNSMQDISARKAAETALRESEAQFRSVFTESPVPIVMHVHSLGPIRAVNRAATTLFEFEEDEVVGRTSIELNLWPDLADRATLVEMLQAQGEVRGVDLVMQTKSGRPINVLYSAVRLMIGGEMRLLSTVIDVTAQKEAEAALRQREELLRQSQKMESLGTLAGGVAHDFNNILTGVIGFAHLAQVDLPSEHPAQSYIDGILRSGARARSLVQQILTFSRRTATVMTPVRMQAVIAETLQLLRSTLPAMVQLESLIDERCPPVMADSNQIHQVILNLCTNAWHALPEMDGRISVRLSNRTLAESELASAPLLVPGSYVVLAVVDNGEGMDAATAGRIFEPFFTTKESGKGTGLGLAVVHSIVLGHRGAVAVQSELGRGTTMEVFLPAISHDAVVPVVSTDLQLADGNGERILVVDDDMVTGSIVTQLLRRVGYKVDHISEPREALKVLVRDRDRYQIVVTDLAMPELPGDEMVRLLREELPDIPVVLLSGFLEPTKVAKLRDLGVRDILSKPPDMVELTQAIRRALHT